VQELTKNSTDFILNNLMIEDVYLYLYKVFDTYAKYLSIDKNELIKDTKSNSNWVCIQQRRIANKKLLKRKENEK